MSKAGLRLVTRPSRTLPNIAYPDNRVHHGCSINAFKFVLEGAGLKAYQRLPFAFLCDYVLKGIEVLHHIKGDYWLCEASDIERRVLRERQEYLQVSEALQATYFTDMVTHNPQWFETIVVPRTVLKDGYEVPSFRASKYLCGRGDDGLLVNHSLTVPLLKSCFRDAHALCVNIGATLMTEEQREAIATNILQQDINWRAPTSEYQRKIYRNCTGLADVDFETTYLYAQGVRRWHELSNGERIFDFARFIPVNAHWPVDLKIEVDKVVSNNVVAMQHLMGRQSCNDHSPIGVRAVVAIPETTFIQRQLI